MGSSLVARQAGKHIAASVEPTTNRMAPTTVAPSAPLTPYTLVEIRRETAAARPRPDNTPSRTNATLCRTTSRSTSRAGAPHLLGRIRPRRRAGVAGDPPRGGAPREPPGESNAGRGGVG